MLPIFQSTDDGEHFFVVDLIVCVLRRPLTVSRYATGCQRLSSSCCSSTPPVAYPDASTSMRVGRSGSHMARIGFFEKVCLSVWKACCCAASQCHGVVLFSDGRFSGRAICKVFNGEAPSACPLWAMAVFDRSQGDFSAAVALRQRRRPRIRGVLYSDRGRQASCRGSSGRCAAGARTSDICPR